LYSLFDKSRSAGQAGGLITVILFFPFFSLDQATLALRTLASFLSPIAFAWGFQGIAISERQQVQITRDNWTGSGGVLVNYNVALGILFCDIIIYALIALYLDEVVPSEFGTHKPWYFPCTFCCSKTVVRTFFSSLFFLLVFFTPLCLLLCWCSFSFQRSEKTRSTNPNTVSEPVSAELDNKKAIEIVGLRYAPPLSAARVICSLHTSSFSSQQGIRRSCLRQGRRQQAHGHPRY
jgi:hypothetical protein